MEEKFDDFDGANSDEKKNGKDFKIEIILFLILGFLLGVMMKTEASKRLTIGFDDYKVTAKESDVNIEKIQKDLLMQQENTAEEVTGEQAEESENIQ